MRNNLFGNVILEIVVPVRLVNHSLDTLRCENNGVLDEHAKS